MHTTKILSPKTDNASLDSKFPGGSDTPQKFWDLLSNQRSALIANRISHFFDLRGPSITLDTCCSGSMIALHQACQSIKSGESTMAIVAAATFILDPLPMVGMTHMGYVFQFS
jgi:acyl transferase domain-containing protein